MCRVDINGNYGGAPWTNVFWVLTTGYDLADGADLAALLTDFLGSYLTNFMGGTSTANNLTSAHGVLFQTSTEVEATVSSAHAGSDGGTIAPASASVLLSWSIASYYRGGKPRNYIGGQVSSALAGPHEWTSGHVAYMTAAGAGFLSDVNGFTTTHLLTVTLGVLRRMSGGVPLTPGVFYPYFAVAAKSGIASMRRRNEFSSS
jgi:hypothetical protein